MKNVFVTGDFVLDQYLIKEAQTPTSYVEPMQKTVARTTQGGAWFLARMVKLTCESVARTKVFAPDALPENQVAHAHSVWTRFARVHDKPKETVWRIGEFLGCERAKQSCDAKTVKLVSGANLGRPLDLLVLEDLRLGFAEDAKNWPKVVHDELGSTHILLKLNARPEPNKLWNHLLEHHADRLTAVVSINSLRARGAAVSFGLSWDQTIEELAREFESGPSAYDLARCRRTVVYFPDGTAAASFSRCHPKTPAATATGRKARRTESLRPLASLERFLYLPDEVEGFWRAKFDGMLFGIGSIVTATVARNLLDPTSYPLYVTLGRALAAGRHLLEVGGGSSDSEVKLDEDGLRNRLLFAPTTDKTKEDKSKSDPAFEYFTAYPHNVLDNERLQSQPATQSDLLRDVAGPTVDYMKAKAFEVVMEGPEQALRSVPKARYGKYLTVDRQEIERINAVRALINEYRRNVDDKRPLSISVFGQPGSGKSFAIKQLGESLFGEKNPVLEFNLSQFTSGDMHQLHQAFHRIRDASIKGEIPLVFWDEFDTDGLSWLKHFLAPMQDAEFRSGGDLHVFGKAIFVFAGGTKPTFAEFDDSDAMDEQARRTFRDRKGPDFVSRLRGYIDIKGPNPVGKRNDDPAYVIRRAMILRSTLENMYKQLIDRASNRARLDAAIVHAFLNVDQFLHGARSLQSVLGMSRLQGTNHFDVARLNSPNLLEMHVSKDFLTHVQEAAFDQNLIRALSEAVHEGWYQARKAQRWKYTKGQRDDVRKRHPRLLPFNELTAADQERNAAVARVVPAKLAEIGYKVIRQSPLSSSVVNEVSKIEQEQLARDEHDRWLRERLIEGYEFANATNEALRQHQDIARFDDLGPEEKQLDNALGEVLSKILAQHRLQLVRIPK